MTGGVLYKDRIYYECLPGGGLSLILKTATWNNISLKTDNFKNKMNKPKEQKIVLKITHAHAHAHAHAHVT